MKKKSVIEPMVIEILFSPFYVYSGDRVTREHVQCVTHLSEK